jgi:hypothetical protein
MKHLKFIFLMLTLIVFGHLISAQPKKKKFDLHQKIYWFYLNVSIKTDNLHNRDRYMVRIPSRKPKYGTYLDYEKGLWRCLQKGYQILIGPFKEYEAAKQALAIYDLSRLSACLREQKLREMGDSIRLDGSEYFCYYMKFKITKRTKSIRLERIPARTSVDGISMDFFIDQFLEGVTMKMLAVGPFPTKDEAEDSKWLNRLEE